MGRDPLFTIPEAAVVLNVSRSTIYRLIRRGELVVCKLGRCVRIPSAAVYALMGAELTASQTTRNG